MGAGAHILYICVPVGSAAAVTSVSPAPLSANVKGTAVLLALGVGWLVGCAAGCAPVA